MRWGPQNKLQKTLNVLMLTTLFLTGGLFKFQLPKANGRQKAETVGDLLVLWSFVGMASMQQFLNLRCAWML